MVNEAIDWLFSSTGLFFGLILNSWLLSSFMFVSILGLIVNLIVNVRNK